MKLILTLILSSLASIGLGQGLVYQLSADSSITPAVSGIPSGPSQSLAGSFTWVPHFPSYITDSDTFDITSLSFTSLSYVLTLAFTSQPDNTTQTGPDGQTTLNANVNWSGSVNNPWYLGAYGSGSFVGPATAPTELIFSAEGFYPAGGGPNGANLYIHAILVPEPATLSLMALTAFGLAFRSVRIASPKAPNSDVGAHTNCQHTD